MRFVAALLLAGCAMPEAMSAMGRNPHGAEEFRRAIDGMIVIRIPAGEFIMGDNKGDREEHPRRTVKLTHDILIDKFEVTNEQFAKFMNASGKDEYVDAAVGGVEKHGDSWRPAPGREKHPVTAATFWGAEGYARWVGGHLPTDVEWEKAARGTDGRDYPWGNDPPDPTYCNYMPTGLGDTAAVGSFPKGASPYGVMDMAGNVYERIVMDTEFSKLPRAGMIKSSAFVCPMAFQMRSSDYCGYRTDKSSATIGFRCVMRP